MRRPAGLRCGSHAIPHDRPNQASRSRRVSDSVDPARACRWSRRTGAQPRALPAAKWHRRGPNPGAVLLAALMCQALSDCHDWRPISGRQTRRLWVGSGLAHARVLFGPKGRLSSWRARARSSPQARARGATREPARRTRARRWPKALGAETVSAALLIMRASRTDTPAQRSEPVAKSRPWQARHRRAGAGPSFGNADAEGPEGRYRPWPVSRRVREHSESRCPRGRRHVPLGRRHPLPCKRGRAFYWFGWDPDERVDEGAECQCHSSRWQLAARWRGGGAGIRDADDPIADRGLCQNTSAQCGAAGWRRGRRDRPVGRGSLHRGHTARPTGCFPLSHRIIDVGGSQ